MRKKLTVLFPGIGYHCDKPLLYYSRKLAKKYEHDVVEIRYEFDGEIPGIKNNPDKMLVAIEDFTEQAKKQLSEVVFEDYDNIIFVGKSIGTAIAARIAREKGMVIGQLVYTPVPDTLHNLPRENVVVFHGLSDPWCENDIVEDAQKEIGFELHLVDGANHSLETGDPLEDLRIVRDVIETAEMFYGAR
jgi:phosphoglycolate phosphatase